MPFCYDRLWLLLKARNIKKEDLRIAAKLSPNTLVRMGKNYPVTLDVIDKICLYLDCIPQDIMQYSSSKFINFVGGIYSFSIPDIFADFFCVIKENFNYIYISPITNFKRNSLCVEITTIHKDKNMYIDLSYLYITERKTIQNILPKYIIDGQSQINIEHMLNKIM